jgi:deoxyribodipyrimidine photo-lyase
MEYKFTTDYKEILNKIDKIDPIKYGKTRNYIDGAVTYLSPYISRGVISTQQVLTNVLNRGFAINHIESFTKELCWRDYFQRVAQNKDINQELKNEQTPILNYEVPVDILNYNTGIVVIDNALKNLIDFGYIHNHARMYVSSIVCNIAQSHWKNPAHWMYYYLLDGDWASNACSWQWVCAANSNKKYYANQENINKFTNSNQRRTFLDYEYETLAENKVPEQLKITKKFDLQTNLPISKDLEILDNCPTFVYNYYNLDPIWHQETHGNRVLLLDPEFFNKYPVSENCISFVLELSKNIEGIQVFVGSFQELTSQLKNKEIYYKEHPLNLGYFGKEESRDWIIPEVQGYFPSFFSYWKKIEREIFKNYKKI